MRLYRDNGKENGNYYSDVGCRVYLDGLGINYGSTGVNWLMIRITNRPSRPYDSGFGGFGVGDPEWTWQLELLGPMVVL